MGCNMLQKRHNSTAEAQMQPRSGPKQGLVPLIVKTFIVNCYTVVCSARRRQDECSISRHCILVENAANVSCYRAGSSGLHHTLKLHKKSYTGLVPELGGDQAGPAPVRAVPCSREDARSRQGGRAAPCPVTYTAPARRASNARASFTPVIVDCLD